MLCNQDGNSAEEEATTMQSVTVMSCNQDGNLAPTVMLRNQNGNLAEDGGELILFYWNEERKREHKDYSTQGYPHIQSTIVLSRKSLFSINTRILSFFERFDQASTTSVEFPS
jgi:hypothetical protein